MLRAGPVTPGKYLILICGDEASVQESFEAGRERADDALLDSLYLLAGGILFIYLVHRAASRFLYPLLPNPSFLKIFFGALYVLVETDGALQVAVVTSNTSALKEVAEGYAHLVNPLDVEEIAKAIALRCEQIRTLARFDRSLEWWSMGQAVLAGFVLVPNLGFEGAARLLRTHEVAGDIEVGRCAGEILRRLPLDRQRCRRRRRHAHVAHVDNGRQHVETAAHTLPRWRIPARQGVEDCCLAHTWQANNADFHFVIPLLFSRKLVP